MQLGTEVMRVKWFGISKLKCIFSVLTSFERNLELASAPQGLTCIQQMPSSRYICTYFNYHNRVEYFTCDKRNYFQCGNNAPC